jgi:hypothetical protein
MDAELTDVITQLQLRRLAEDYAAAADAADGDAFAAVFTPDGILEVKQAGFDDPVVHAEGSEELAAVMLLFGPFIFTMHLVCNHRVAIDGDRAAGETYCIANHVTQVEGGRENMVQYIRYLDQYERTEAGWRFSRRDNLVRWQQIQPFTGMPMILDPASPPKPTRGAENTWSGAVANHRA